MKIAYIILPFESSEYLIRCVNSICRQTSDRENFYIILAENNFRNNSEKIEKYLSDRPEIIRIPAGTENNKEKIKSAVSLIPEDAEYVMFTYADTVFSPAAFGEISRYDASSIIMVGSAAKEQDTFKKIIYTKKNVNMLSSAWGITDIAVRRNILVKADSECLCNNAYFRLFIADEASKNDREISVCDNICIYTSGISKPSSYPDFTEYSEYAAQVFENLLRRSDLQRRMEIYDSFMDIFIKCIDSEDASEEKKKAAFNIILKISEFIKKDIMLNKLNELNTGCSADEISEMDYYSYVQFRQLKRRYSDNLTEAVISNAINHSMEEQNNNIGSLTNEFTALRQEMNSNKMIVDELYKESLSISTQLEEVNQKDADIYSETEKIKNDIAALSKNIHFLSQAVSELNKTSESAAIDPLRDIPRVFASGRAGFSVIIKSIGAWFRYKFSRK